jgi:hypothetical protein
MTNDGMTKEILMTNEEEQRFHHGTIRHSCFVQPSPGSGLASINSSFVIRHSSFWS